MIWVNGKRQEMISARDRSVQFGDGCFTTALVHKKRILLQKQHLQRLRMAAQRLFISDIDWQRVEQEMSTAAATANEDAVIKVILSRGDGGRGYSAVGCRSVCIVSLSSYPQSYALLRKRGVRLTQSPIRLAQNPLLAGIKHLNRLEQVLIKLHLEQSDADETLVLDTAGSLIECCAANLFWRQGREVFTPSLENAGVLGIMRQRIISLLPQLGYRCQEVTAGPKVLAKAQEILICNALMPVLPVNSLDGQHYSCRQLFNELLWRCYQELGL